MSPNDARSRYARAAPQASVPPLRPPVEGGLARRSAECEGKYSLGKGSDHIQFARACQARRAARRRGGAALRNVRSPHPINVRLRHRQGRPPPRAPPSPPALRRNAPAAARPRTRRPPRTSLAPALREATRVAAAASMERARRAPPAPGASRLTGGAAWRSPSPFPKRLPGRCPQEPVASANHPPAPTRRAKLLSPALLKVTRVAAMTSTPTKRPSPHKTRPARSRSDTCRRLAQVPRLANVGGPHLALREATRGAVAPSINRARDAPSTPEPHPAYPERGGGAREPGAAFGPSGEPSASANVGSPPLPPTNTYSP